MTRNEEIVLLAIWRLKDNAYGVSIRDMITAMTGREWAFGQVYMPLDKLAQMKFVQKSTSDPTKQRGGRSKCMYSLTLEGKRALNEVRKLQSDLWADISPMAFEGEC